MNETGLNNPIFGMMNSQNQSNMGSGGMNQNMGMGMNNMNMNQGMMSQNTMGMNNMNMNQGMMNPMGMMNQNTMGMNNMNMNQGMMNPAMMGMGMGMGMMNMPMNTMMNMNQASQANAAMNQILNSQNQSQNQSSINPATSSSGSNGGITVLFRRNNSPGEKPYAVQCMLTDRVSEIILKYRSKSNDKDPTKKFIFNAKALNATLTAAEAGLTDQANVFVVTTQNVVGA